MDFDSYKAESVAVAVGLVNRLTAGTDGTRRVQVPQDLRGRRGRVADVAGLTGRRYDAADLDGFVELAARLRQVFERCHRADVDGAAQLVNELLEGYGSMPRLIRHDGHPWHLHFHSADADTVGGLGAGCATGLAIVIGSGQADRLGICTAAPCDRVFVDISRNGNRRFCSARCANRYTVAAHRARQRSG
jgi:predicted RNA-binding Zn ribbon-like protein